MKSGPTYVPIVLFVGMLLSLVVVAAVVRPGPAQPVNHASDYLREACADMCEAVDSEMEIVTYEYGCLCADDTHFPGHR